ncbi:MAG: hypothetical protein AB1492_05645 [Bacillota bacterium]
MAAKPGEVAFLCKQCGVGCEAVDDELVQVPVEFAVPKRDPGALACYLPVWVFAAQLKLSRQSAGFSLFGGRNSGEYDLKFYVPAFAGGLATLKQLGAGLTRKQPEYDTILRQQLAGIALRREDAKRVADYLLITIEAEKPDMLQGLTYSLELSQAKLLGIPCVRQGDKLKEALTGLTFSYQL